MTTAELYITEIVHTHKTERCAIRGFITRLYNSFKISLTFFRKSAFKAERLRSTEKIAPIEKNATLFNSLYWTRACFFKRIATTTEKSATTATSVLRFPESCGIKELI